MVIRPLVLVIQAAVLVIDGSLGRPQGPHQFVPFKDELEGESKEKGDSAHWNFLTVFNIARVKDVPARDGSTVPQRQNISGHTTMILRSADQSATSFAPQISTGRPRPVGSCGNIFCPAGRVCKVMDKRSKCICRDHCPAGKEVCGTDGATYPSHCELHRTACLRNHRIGVDHTGSSCRKDSEGKTEVVAVGNSIELKCCAKDGGLVSWKRNGASLLHVETDEIKTYEDGSLYIGNLALHLMGNYTCHDRTTDSLIQRHRLIIQEPPMVFVYPHSHFCHPGATIVLKCHALGVPQPTVTWQHGGQLVDIRTSLDSGGPQRSFLCNNRVLELEGLRHSESFECHARSAAGADGRTIKVTIEGNNSVEESPSELFVVFHDRGYTVYEVGLCHMKHQVTSEFLLPNGSPEFGLRDFGALCPVNRSCSWGDAATVRDYFVYVTQPFEKRVIVIDLKDRFNPVEVIILEGHPVSVNYVDHLDEVFVICLTEMKEEAPKMAVVLRDVTKLQRHQPVHVRSENGKIDLIENLFLPSDFILKNSVSFGYVAYRNMMTLQKLNLVSMEYISHVDLSSQDCIPTTAVIIPIGGYVMVSCKHPGASSESSFLLVLDYVTDSVLGKSDIRGKPVVSPDSHSAVVLDGNRKTVSVFKINDEGDLEHRFDEYLEVEIGHLSFLPSESGIGYSVFAASFLQPTILLLDILSGRVSLIEGVAAIAQPPWWAPVKRNHLISSVTMFSEHLMVSSIASVTTFDIGTRRAQCTWHDVRGGRLLVPVPLSG